MYFKNLKKYFLKEFKNKNYSFILPITIGYSSTGSNDPINQILNLITTLKKTVSKFECFCWVDAAAQGIPKSFLDENFSPLEDELIQGYIVDFHKFGTTPLPSGVVLYRKELRSIIETSISYLDENDNTILGSRPGSAALALWGAIVAKSIPSWKKHFLKLENKKNSLISVIKKKSPNVTIINTQHSLTMAIEINRFFPDMSKEIENRYSFVRCKIGSFEHYKVHIQN